MFCKWCGMESETGDVCSWCRKPFSTAATVQEPPKPTSAEPSRGESATPSGASPAPAQPGSGERPIAEFLDDDLNPMPFGGPISPTPTGPLAGRRETPPPPAVPPASARQAPPAYVPPTIQQGRTPPAIRQPTDDRPSLEAIPLKRPGGGAIPPIIPVSRPREAPAPQPAAPPAGAPPPAAPAASMPPPLPLRPQPAPPGPPPVAPPVAQEPLAAAPEPPAPLAEPEAAPAPDMAAPEPFELDLPPLAPEEPEDEAPPIAVPMARRLDLGAGAPAQAAPPPPPQVPRSTVTVPKAGGRTWYCRWCGMESEAPDVCSWCRRDLRGLPATAPGKGPHVTITHSPNHHRRAPVRAQARPAPHGGAAAPAPAAEENVAAPAPPARSQAGVPQLGMFQAQKSKYYENQVVDSVSGRHYDADTGQTTDVAEEAPIVTEEVNLPRQAAIYAGVLAGIAVIVGVVGSLAPQSYLLLLAASNFAAGMAMPLLRVVPFGEDDSDDVALAMFLFLVFGPFVGALFYGVVGVMRQDANPAIVGIFVSYLVLRVVADVTTGHAFVQLLPFSSRDILVYVAQWMTFAGLAGWYAAGVFHKPDE